MTFDIVVSNWGWPQWVYMSLACLTLIGAISLHGKPREPYNGYARVIGFMIVLFLLSAGGFFS